MPSNNNKVNSWTVRIIAFLVACGLWLYVMNEQNPLTNRTYTVALGKENLSSKMVVLDMPESVRVKISGPRAALSSLSEESIQAYVDFSTATKGRNMYNVRARSAVGDVIEISPSLLQLDVDEVSEKLVEVEPRIVGVPDSGITVGKLNVDPIRVTIKGAASKLANVDKVVVLVDISNKEKNFEEEDNVVVLGKDGRQMQNFVLMPAKVKVSAVVLKQLATANVPIKAELSGNLPTGFAVESVTLKPTSIKLTAEPKILGSISEIKTAPVVLDKLTGDVEVEMPLSIPDKVLAEQHSVVVSIKLKRIEAPPPEIGEKKN